MSEHQWNFPATVQPGNYDGDTFTARIDLGFGMSVVKTVQLEGVDAPGLNAKPEAVRALAERARREAAAFLKRAKRIVLRSTTWERRQRDAVGDLVADGKSLSEWLVEMRYAIPHDGDRSRDARAARRERHAENARALIAEGQLEV